MQKFLQNYDDDSNKGYILEVDVSYLKRLQKMHSYLLFQLERIKIDKFKKLVCNMYDKKTYVVHIKALKLVLDYGLILEKVHRVIELIKETCPSIDMKINLRTKAKNDFEKDFFKLMNDLVFRKTTENVGVTETLNL